jgi:hypothetical protein
MVLPDPADQRVKEGRHSPQGLALIADIESQVAQLKSARRRYAVLLWRYVAHLHRQGAAARNIARRTSLPTAMIERRTICVPGDTQRIKNSARIPQCVEEMPLVPDQGAVQQFTRSSCLGDRQSCQSGRRRRSGRHPANRRALAPTSADDVIGKGKVTGINRSFVACGTDP